MKEKEEILNLSREFANIKTSHKNPILQQVEAESLADGFYVGYRTCQEDFLRDFINSMKRIGLTIIITDD